MNRERGEDKQEKRRGRQFDAAVRQNRCAERAGRDADGEEEVDRDLDVDSAADPRI
jgi:hypothetical protein